MHLIGKQKHSRMEKRKFIIAMQVLQEVSVTFPGTENFVDEKLE